MKKEQEDVDSQRRQTHDKHDGPEDPEPMGQADGGVAFSTACVVPTCRSDVPAESRDSHDLGGR